MLKLNNSNIFVSSDFHFHHRNICRGVTRWGFYGQKELENATRDFQTLKEMDLAIVNSINSTVSKHDTLFFLGDWSFGGIEYVHEASQSIICENIHFIYGNHDHHIRNNKDNCQERFLSVSDYQKISVTEGITNLELILCHYPIASWDNMRNGSLHIHGHLHRKGDQVFGLGKMMDVGIDGHPEFRPYHISEIIKLLENRPKLSLYNDLG
jgi:calcineurin-like phosphoesterase family protein